MKSRSKKLSKSKNKPVGRRKVKKSLRRNGFLDFMNRTGKYDPYQKKSSITEEERQKLLNLEARKYSTISGYVEKSEIQFYDLLNRFRENINNLHDRLLKSGDPNKTKKLSELIKFAYFRLNQINEQILTGELPKKKAPTETPTIATEAWVSR